MEPHTKQVTQQNFEFLIATTLGQHTPKHLLGFRVCLTALGCGLSKTGMSFSRAALFIVSGRHQAKLCGFAWFPSERQRKLAISADFLLWVLVRMREKREEVSLKS